MMAMAAACPPPASAAPARFQVVEIEDRHGFERPMRAASTLVPAGWTVSGGGYYDQRDTCHGGPKTDWTARAPDGAGEVRVLPNFSWSANTMGTPHELGCPVMALQSGMDVAQAVVAAMPGGKITGQREVAGLSRALAPYRTEMQGDPYMVQWFDYTEVDFTYMEGRTLRRGVMTVLSSHAYMKSGYSFNTGFAPYEMISGSAMSIITYTAPQAAFDEGVFRIALSNLQLDVEWNARTAQLRQAGQRVMLEENRKRALAIKDTFDEIGALSTATYNARWASEDRIARERGETLKGIETYDADVPGGQVELPDLYRYAWQLQDGSFVMTDEHGFEPFRDLGIEGRRITPAR